MPDIINLFTNTIQGAFSSKESRTSCWNLNQTLQVSLGFVVVNAIIGMVGSYLSPLASVQFSIAQVVITQLILPIGYFFAVSYLFFAWVKSAKANETFTLLKVQQTLAQGILLSITANLIILATSLIGLAFVGIIASLILVVISLLFMCKTLADNLTFGAWGVFFRLALIGILTAIIGGIAVAVLGLTPTSNLDSSNPEAMMEIQANFMENLLEKAAEQDGATAEEMAEAKESIDMITDSMVDLLQQADTEQ